jgi:CheY-like chemotaxis protein
MGNLSLIHNSVRLDPDTAKALADAETALVRARDLTQQLLTFSRGGAPVRETASVREVLRDSASFVLRGSKVRFDLDLASDLWLVDIDAGQISQVMQNLLINAEQAMPAGGTVRISAHNVDSVPQALANSPAVRGAGGRFVRIDVEDEGIGIAADVQMRIFDPYFSTKEEGRGLGLASAYAIVKKHDGLLTVRSEPPGGTTFSIFLPGSSQGMRESSSRDPSGPIPVGGLPGFTGRRVLLMDDDRVVRRTAGAMLERLGCEVVHADHGARALVLYEEALDDGNPFDAVLMDLTVPGGMGGQEAVARLRTLDPEAVAIVYSGYSTDPVLANYADYGFDGRLSKPFRIRELAVVLEEVLGS